MHAIAEEIIIKETGTPPLDLKPLTGGLDNHVYRARLKDGLKVVRFKKDYLDTYKKEQWVMEQVAAAGVPTANVHSVGQHGEYGYIIINWIEGTVGSEYKGDAIPLYRELGRLARLINGIGVEGYGHHLDLSPEPHFRETWQQTLDWEWDYIFGNDALLRLNALTPAQLKQARALLNEMEHWDYPPCLSHNDLYLENAILAHDGTLYLIDWTLAQGRPAPYFDVGNFLGSAEEREQKEAFLDGYGLNRQQYDQVKTELSSVSLLNVLRATVWAYKDCPQVLDKTVKRTQQMVKELFGS